MLIVGSRIKPFLRIRRKPVLIWFYCSFYSLNLHRWRFYQKFGSFFTLISETIAELCSFFSTKKKRPNSCGPDRIHINRENSSFSLLVQTNDWALIQWKDIDTFYSLYILIFKNRNWKKYGVSVWLFDSLW